MDAWMKRGDVDWKTVIVEQAPFNTAFYDRQFTGGSQGIRRGWQGLRMAGAAARQMLREATAQAWQASRTIPGIR